MKVFGVYVAEGALDGLTYELWDDPVSPQVAPGGDESVGTYVLPGGFSTGLPARYTMRGFDA